MWKEGRNGKARTKECEGLEKERTSVEEREGRKEKVREGRKRDLIPFFGNRLGANSLLAVWEAPKPSATGSVFWVGTIHPPPSQRACRGRQLLSGPWW